MWNWLVFGLVVGVSLVFYDGLLFYFGFECLLDFIDVEDIVVFGVSVKYLVVFEKVGVCLCYSYCLDSLRILFFIGLLLVYESFDYVYCELKSDFCLLLIFGGIDIVFCFVIGNLVLLVWCGEL